MSSKLGKGYGPMLKELKEKIRQARLRASLAVNKELLQVYWEIGRSISEQELLKGWGAKTVERLARDLRLEFNDMRGISPRNLRYMRDFTRAYPHFPFLQGGLAKLKRSEDKFENSQIPLTELTWYHHITLLDKVKDPETRRFYIQKAVGYRWTRDMLVHQIESGLHKRQGALTHNFKKTLPDYQSELTQQLFKDPYHLDFIMIKDLAKERDLENGITTHIAKVLIELGEGFAFMGRQYRLEVGGQEYFLDLLFYHTRLRRHIVIDLKISDFVPEYAGKMNFYLGIVDDKLKGRHDEASIGLILCKTKNKIVAEYALRDTGKPIGVAEYRVNERLPENIKLDLPSSEVIEQKLGTFLGL